MVFTLTNQEASALAPVIEICCADASKQFTVTKTDGASPMADDSFKARAAISSCVESSYREVQTNCEEAYEAYFDCIGPKLRKPYVKCLDLKKVLQKCAVKHNVGELKN